MPATLSLHCSDIVIHFWPIVLVWADSILWLDSSLAFSPSAKQIPHCNPPHPPIQPAMFLQNVKPQKTNKPKPHVNPRTRLQGGFIIDCNTAIDWAERLCGERLGKDELDIVWDIIEDRVQEFGSRFSFVRPVLYKEFMVVTRRLHFATGYLGMPPEETPRFHEAEKEMRMRELLKDEGLGELVFGTRLD
ncbi:hypothetical protein EDD18DRAFT_1344186 [Armillaria luteobubalina]|uniref:Uncharacterized protein n=1 Tax=Armillaria luteobubalina TaxID=153913 RepID=A0AA39QLW9_9AGAR|nr:hypothetical protein EDD18DRAFT_1344186 [Armillaria luteobubalina]